MRFLGLLYTKVTNSHSFESLIPVYPFIEIPSLDYITYPNKHHGQLTRTKEKYLVYLIDLYSMSMFQFPEDQTRQVELLHLRQQ